MDETVKPEAQRAGQSSRRPVDRTPSQACSRTQRHRQAYSARRARGFPLGAPMWQTRGREMESVSLPQHFEEIITRGASAEVGSTQMDE